jgi:hypothetical protein
MYTNCDYSRGIRHRAIITVRVSGAEAKPWRQEIKDNHEVETADTDFYQQRTEKLFLQYDKCFSQEEITSSCQTVS